MKILLDMDDVVVDFVTASLRFFGADPDKFYAKHERLPYDYYSLLGLSRLDFVALIDKAGEKFWLDLPPLPRPRELYDYCVSLAPTYFLTKPMSPESASAKIKWLRTWLKDPQFDKYALTSHKYLCAHRDRVLIDDNETNVKAYRLEGGPAILFPSRWNSAHAHTDTAVDMVKDLLHLVSCGDQADRCLRRNLAESREE